MTESAFGDTFPPFDGTADTLVRSIVTYLVESTDTPDDTPERLERTLGIALRELEGSAVASVHLNPHPWRASVVFDPIGITGPSVTLQIDTTENDAVLPFPTVGSLDSEGIADVMREHGFHLVDRGSAHGRFDGRSFARGNVKGFLAVRGRSLEEPNRKVVNHISARWTNGDD
ncbi:hypothetical protein F8O01_12795 [Pseudoclavibacter chungangensis]|uniref:Uncharacterized protein n=1 Tax=Pseudoclavibacter chungangensis TaxID=587635 RepID=A0A7J5BPB5_9MICO|nr:hypothetical protein [Pseudoclavibacter chungangensis]KAB1654779.1 hypothetical protein F8O01_12795 [Pseudoclavibacter chungangensis]NYJ68115.1 hypothetical protein [Pseudoclavibacter chungangensis]